MAKHKKIDLGKLVDLRKETGENQETFWRRFGVTQSGGSRYETGRDMPRPVSELLRLVHVEGIDLERARGEDFKIANTLRLTNLALYRRLRAEIRKNRQRPG